MEENRIEVPLTEECLICLEETDNFIFFNCGHKACPTCFPKLHRCPLCQPNTKIQNHPPVRMHEVDKEDYCKLCCSMLIIIMFCVWCIHIVGLF